MGLNFTKTHSAIRRRRISINIGANTFGLHRHLLLTLNGYSQHLTTYQKRHNLLTTSAPNTTLLRGRSTTFFRHLSNHQRTIMRRIRITHHSQATLRHLSRLALASHNLKQHMIRALKHRRGPTILSKFSNKTLGQPYTIVTLSRTQTATQERGRTRTLKGHHSVLTTRPTHSTNDLNNGRQFTRSDLSELSTHKVRDIITLRIT